MYTEFLYTSCPVYKQCIFLTGDSGAVKQLLDSTQLDPDSRTRYQSRSALHLACGYGQMSVVEELLLVRTSFVVSHKTIKSQTIKSMYSLFFFNAEEKT